MIKTVLHRNKHLYPGRSLKGMVVLLLLHYSPAYAQITDTTKNLKEVTVQSSIITQPGLAPMQIISSPDFIKISAYNVADAIRNFAGVNIRDYGGIGGLKTVSVRSIDAGHTAVLYDGIQVNDAQNGQVDLGRFNLVNVQSISLYTPHLNELCMPARTFAAASVLTISTVKPNLNSIKPFQLTAGIKTGSFGLVNPYLQWQHRLSDNWSFIITGQAQDANGKYKYKDPFKAGATSTRVNGDIAVQQLEGALYWAKTDSNKFHIQFNYNNSDRGLPGAVIQNAVYDKQRLRNSDVLVQAGYECLWQNSLHLLLNTKVSRNYQHYTDIFYLKEGGADDKYTLKEFYQSAAISYKLLKSLEVSYATDVAVTDLNTNAYIYAFPTRLSLFNNIAAKLKAGRWELQGNLLNTYIRDVVENGQAAASRSVFSPTIMASFAPFANNNIRVRAFYKELFRNPNFTEQYYYATRPRDIKPEYVKQYDLGITYTRYFNDVLQYLSVMADAYYNNVNDKILFLPGRSAEIPSVVNLGKVDIRGLDVNIKSLLKFSHSWSGNLSAGYTFQKAVDVTNVNDDYYQQQIPYTPENTLTLNAGISYNNLGFYYNHIYSSLRYYTSNNKTEYLVPGYHISDASVQYRFKAYKKPVLVSAEVNNLFNQNYQVIRSYPMPPRSYRLTFQVTI